MDEYLSFLIYSAVRSPFLDFFAQIFTVLFSYAVILPLIFVFYVLKSDEKRFLLFISALSTGFSVFVLKHIVGRIRPLYGTNVFLSSGYSFPSGHTAGAFVLASVLSHYYPKKKPVFYAIAFFVGFFRIYSGSHYILDVVFGGFLGWFIGKLFIKFEDRVVDLNNKILKYIK